MDIDRIVVELRRERERLDKAISTLEGIDRASDGARAQRRTSPPRTITNTKAVRTASTGGRRPLSAAARRRISEAQKRRWAEVRKAA